MAPGIDKYIDTEICMQLQRAMEQYIMKMDVFRPRVPLNRMLFGKKEDVPKGLNVLVAKHDWSTLNTLQDVENCRKHIVTRPLASS